MKKYIALLSPALIVLLLIVAFPTVYLLYVSFHQWFLYVPGLEFVGFGNFETLLRSPVFHSSVWVTIRYVVLSTLLTAIVGFFLAVLMSGALRAKGLLRTLVVLPLIIPPVVAGFSWKFLLSREVGLIGGWLLPSLGLKASVLAEPTLAFIAILIADLWAKTPLMFLIFLAGLQAIPTDLYEMAEMDGANSMQFIWEIILPLLRPTIALALVLRLIDAMNVFDLIFVMTSGGPGVATQTLPLLGWKIGFVHFDLGQASALAVIMLILTVAPSSMLIRRMTRLTA
ncbi:MAG: sugar ABC transporter permease [Chloroflexi bacterium]|nr:sugar ABC transporter permease [Chloroflexota bacterium]